MKKNKEALQFLYIKIFIVILFIVIVISLAVKGLTLYNSRHFTANSFTLLVISQDPYVIGVNKNMDMVSVLKLKNSEGKLVKGFPMKNSINLKVPLDGVLVLNTASEDDIPKDFFSIGKFIPLVFKNPNSYYNINVFDLIQIFNIARAKPSDEVLLDELDMVTYENSASRGENEFVPQTTNMLFELFRDQDILNEKSSVEVINATHIVGLGTRTAEMLKNIGVNVVNVESSDQKKYSTLIYHDISPEQTALRRMQKIFPFKTEYKSETSIADISIVIGEDMESKLK